MKKTGWHGGWQNCWHYNLMNKPEDYKHIRAWGRMMQSYDYYIENKQKAAAAANAPLDACFERDGAWVCASGLRQELQDELKNLL